MSADLALGGDAMVLRREERFPVSQSALRAAAAGNGAGARTPGRLPGVLRPALFFSLTGQRRKSFHQRKRGRQHNTAQTSDEGGKTSLF